MSLSLSSIRRGDMHKPPRILVYAPHGVGKTTWACSAPNPIVLQTEDGLGIIDAPTFGLLKSYDAVLEAIGVLLSEEHDFKTVVIDSADHLEPLLWQRVCRDNKWGSIEEPGYGKGYVAAVDAWRDFMDGLNALRDERGMSVIIIAHAETKRFDSPETEPYDRYQIKLHARASAVVQETMDCVFFANYRISTVKAETGFNKKVVRGVSGGDRIIHTNERPAYVAKNRFSMPDTVPMTWDAVAEHIPFFAANNA